MSSTVAQPVGATTTRTGPINLSELSDQQQYEIFDRLQRNMPSVWDAMGLNTANESVVVIPSVTLDRLAGGSGCMTQAFEERFRFLLLLLREPRLRMIHVTSTPIAPAIVESWRSHDGSHLRSSCSEAATTEPRSNRSWSFSST